MDRSSGILLHLSSLPGGHGIGDLGPAAIRFLDYLADCKQSWWQMLPVGPIGPGNSPYQSPSSFAGNPLFISLESLRELGLLDHEYRPSSAPSGARVDFGRVIQSKDKWLRRAFRKFDTTSAAFLRFRASQAHWLDDYACFQALSHEHAGLPWTQWPAAERRREPKALAAAQARLRDEIDYQAFLQFQFQHQWERLRRAARDRGIRLIGDVPIFVSHDSAEVWARPELFLLNKKGDPRFVAGVPPDYFCEEGQRWGNPLYDWQAHERERFAWWIDRMKAQCARFDLIRLDHFRGFESYWRIPASAPTAITGQWCDGPRDQFLQALAQALGGLPLIAEDLGDITPEVLALRDRFNLPGMKVLQFAFGSGPSNAYLPCHHARNAVVYTGTHDNDTTRGWIGSLQKSSRTSSSELAFLKRYMGVKTENLAWSLVRAALASVCDLAIIPLQDVLLLGASARMNVPGKPAGNWGWRVTSALLNQAEPRARLREVTEVFDRIR